MEFYSPHVGLDIFIQRIQITKDIILGGVERYFSEGMEGFLFLLFLLSFISSLNKIHAQERIQGGGL